MRLYEHYKLYELDELKQGSSTSKAVLSISLTVHVRMTGRGNDSTAFRKGAPIIIKFVKFIKFEKLIKREQVTNLPIHRTLQT